MPLASMLVCLISTLACRFSQLTSETEVIVEEVVFGEFPKETAEEVWAKYYMPEKEKGVSAGKIRRGKQTPDDDLPMYVSATCYALSSDIV